MWHRPPVHCPKLIVGKYSTVYATICQAEIPCKFFFPVVKHPLSLRIFQYGNDLTDFHLFGLLPYTSFIFPFPRATIHGWMLHSDRNFPHSLHRILKKHPPIKNRGQLTVKYCDSPPYQCMWRTCQYLLHSSTSVQYLFLLFPMPLRLPAYQSSNWFSLTCNRYLSLQ